MRSCFTQVYDIDNIISDIVYCKHSLFEIWQVFSINLGDFYIEQIITGESLNISIL